MLGTQGRTTRVALVGGFGTGNLGNDATLLAAVGALRVHSDVDILCVCRGPEAVTQRYGLAATPIMRHATKRSGGHSLPVRVGRRAMDLVSMYRILKRVDVVMVPGTGILEAGSRPVTASISGLLMVAVAARAARKPFVLVSVGVNVAHRRSTRAVVRWILRLATYRSFRDVHSRHCAVECGAPCDTDAVYPDLVFGLDSPEEPAVQAEPGSVGVGVMAYRMAFFSEEPARRDAIDATYLQSMSAFVEWLLDRGFRVTLLTGSGNDADTAEALRERLADHRPTTLIKIARSESLHDLTQRMRRVNQIVASRYHNIIAAALVGKPVVAVGYDAKHAELMADMGLGRFVQRLERIDGEHLREQFIDLEHSSAAVASRITEKTREYSDRVEQQWSLLTRTLLGDEHTRGA